MRYQHLDLNLLVALRALLNERSVSRSAEKLHVSQPAASAMLAKLREHFDDPLILTVGNSRRLSPMGESLLQPINDLLLRVDSTLARRPFFDASTSQRRFSILASDYVVITLLADVLREIHHCAPGITIEVRSSSPSAPRELENGEVDLLIVPDRLAISGHPNTPLFTDNYQVLYDPEYLRLGKRLALEKYLQFRHVGVGTSTELSSFDRWFAATHPGLRQPELLVSNFQLLPRVVQGTGRVATLHGRMAARVMADTSLQVCIPAFKTPIVAMVLQWHIHRQADAGCEWLRQRIVHHAEAMCPTSGQHS